MLCLKLLQKIFFLAEAIINAADGAKLAAKVTVTQEEVYVAFSTTYIE